MRVGDSFRGRYRPKVAVARCTLCDGSAGFLLRARDRNRRLSREWFHYYRCGDCGLILLGDPPTELASFYGDEYHALPTGAEMQRVARREAYQLEMLVRHTEPGRLVEIGPGAGVFAWQAREGGFSVTAIEMDEGCCRHLRSVVGVEVICSDRPEEAVSSLPPSSAIVLWQALEHLPRPWACLESAVENLEVGGVLLIATPNPQSLGFRVMRARWPHLDAPRHLHLIPAAALSNWLQRRRVSRIALTTDDVGARRWNRFAWQRLLMNSLPSGPLRAVGYVTGAATSAVLSPVERRGLLGSSYTAIFKKTSST